MHDSLGSSGDSDVAVDANGVLYVSDLFSNVPVSTSFDKGATFAYEAQTITGASIDRQWTAASGDGNVFSVVRDGSTEKIAISHDKGVSWTNRVVTTGVGLQGNILATSDNDLYIPYSGSGMRLAISHDAGQTWTTKLVNGAGSTTLFPAVAVDAAGVIYMAWSAKSNADLGYEILVTQSADGGNTWDSAKPLSTVGHTAIFPWIVAGDAGRVAVAWFDGRTPVNQGMSPDLASVAEWVVEVAYTQQGQTGLRSNWAVTDATPVIHRGPICTMGTACFPVSNPVALNRALLDFFEMTTTPSGDIVLAFAADPGAVVNTGGTVLKTVRQTGGPNLKA
ncbi:MAG TPA: sialidase family protein [Candidatus Thermoplasmatota archaeon]|nr:sialidase family protein [Candidatus Thermoplasmatota archaeon]